MVPPSLSPFRHRAFALVWTGAFVSNVGTWMETVALGYYVADTTRQAAWNALIAAAAFVPIGLLGPVGGALADRVSRATLVIATTLAQACLAGVLTALVVAESGSPAVVALISLASGSAAALGFPAMQALIPELVPPDDLVAAVGLGSAQYNLGRIVGPAAAGLVIAVGGVATALAVNAVSFLAVVAVMIAVRLPPRRASPGREPILRAVADGVRFVRREPGLRAAMLVLCLATFLAAPFIALIPAFAVKVLDGDETTTSVLVTAQGVGAVAAAVALGPLTQRLGLRRVLVRAVVALPVALVAYALSPSLPMMALALVVVGGFYLTELSSVATIAQRRAPDALRGRVLSLNAMVLGLLYPAGALLQGRIADEIGLRAVTVAAALLMLAVLAAGRVLRPGVTAPIDMPVRLPADVAAVASS